MKQDTFVDLYTREGEELLRCRRENPQHLPWNAYPRPQLRRDNWTNLNGIWGFQVSASGRKPEKFEEEILVPFPPQSLLSGIHRDVPEEQYLFYRRMFRVDEMTGTRVILHVGAVDQMATVWVNGAMVGEHIGGYEHFSFDITDVLTGGGEQELVIRAVDHLSNHILPYGKQTAKRGGMWYTPVSGIWQSVWLETVPETYIEKLQIETGADWAEFKVQMAGKLQDARTGTVSVVTPEGEIAAEFTDGRNRVEFPEPRMWSPEDPWLYECTIRVGEDQVRSYFALRTLTIEEVDGHQRLCLNGEPYFFHGILDQGYWSDGLLTPADPVCFENDVLAMKELGFNMLRKHIKVEPDLFYYACDRLGMIVFQDMVNNGDYNFIRDTALPTVGLKKKNDRNMHKDPQTRKAFLAGMEQTVAQLKYFPSICYWTIFNEGWGQFDGTGAYHRLKTMDDSRFIDTTSGWFFGSESDVVSEHVYFRPFKVHETDQPLVLSEFGGYCLAVEDHIFNPDKSYGYRTFKTAEDYQNALIEMYETQIVAAVKKGLCGAVYTQVSDVEDEINGLLTYDRKTCKVKKEAMKQIANLLMTEIGRNG